VPSAEIARFLDDRRYLPSGVPLMKHVAALPGQQACRVGAAVTIDGRPVAVAKLQDRMGRALPVWRGCHRVRAGEIFLLNPAPDSLDGRYFGVLPAAGLIGIARPVLTRNAPGEPLRWRVPDRPTAFPTTNQEIKP
jgi:type IV secretory pathway protease TraF